MKASDAIKLSLEMGAMVSLGLLEDLTDAELMLRPGPKLNHINWQVGHLIASEHKLIEQVAPGRMPPLPTGFANKYVKETCESDDPNQFCSKSELLAAYEAQRAGTVAALEQQSDADLGKATEVSYAPTVGAMFSMQGSHWLMHAGQWAVVRRNLGRPPLF